MKQDFAISGSSKNIKYVLILRLSRTLITLLISTLQLQSQENMLRDKWSSNTAYLLPAGRWECGIFQPFRYGLNQNLEIRSDAIILPLLPNAGIKVSLGTWNGFFLACENSVSFPTLLLNLVSFKGTGGLISPQYNFPFILAFNNSLIVTKPAGIKSLFSGNVGFTFAIRDSRPDYQSTIDMPLLYPRMAHYYEGASLRAGISFKGVMTKKLYYEESLRTFLITRSRDNFFIENSGTIMWAAGISLRLKGGYVLSYGRYPFGSHLQMWPALDVVFGSRKQEAHGDTRLKP